VCQGLLNSRWWRLYYPVFSYSGLAYMFNPSAISLELYPEAYNKVIESTLHLCLIS